MFNLAATKPRLFMNAALLLGALVVTLSNMQSVVTLMARV